MIRKNKIDQLTKIAPIVRGLLAEPTGSDDIPYRPVILNSLTQGAIDTDKQALYVDSLKSDEDTEKIRAQLQVAIHAYVADPDSPFIGVIEHTNFQPTESCGDLHIVYLSEYLPETAELYHMNKEQVFEFALSHIKRMFPKFDRSWVRCYHVHKARYAQPIVERYYSTLIPSNTTPIDALYIEAVAQIYPEERGTNYAIREGRRIGRIVAECLNNGLWTKEAEQKLLEKLATKTRRHKEKNT